MADSTTCNLNLNTESIQAAAEDTREVQITNQAAAEDGSTFMDPKLYEAAAHGDIHVLERHDIRVHRTPKKNTVLHVAAQFGQADCVKWILQLPSSSLLQQPNEKGDTPLHLAAREGHLTVVKVLIDAAKVGDAESGAAADCTVMLRMINKDNDTALHEAVRNHHPEVVKLLIQEDPDFTYGANTEGNTPLYIAAEWGFVDLVHMILDNCSSPAHDGVNGRTALHAAVILNNEAMTKKILEWKSDLTKELDQNDDEIGNRTALHIAARRGHVGLSEGAGVNTFQDCCEKVDDKGNNVLHLIMPKKNICNFGLSNNPRLRMRGLMNEKNAEGTTPLHLLHNSPLSKGVNYFPPPETTFTWILDTFVRSRRRSPSFRAGIRPLGSLEVKKDMDSSESKGSEKISESKGSEESKEISEIKKTMKSHMIVVALIATVTFTAGFTLPGGYIQDKGVTQGMAILSLPTDGTLDKHGDMASAAKENFSNFVMEDSIAMVLSMCAIGIYFLASFPIENKKTVHAYVLYGYVLTLAAMAVMVIAFVDGLQAVLHPSSSLEVTTEYMIVVFLLFFFVPALPLLVTISRDFVVPLLVTISRDFVWKKFVSL
ncbi:ankyrin repeat-containing protein At5g02620-like [Vitis riparia]|uniref:ankyrin repeat-containing protein At5g02620-like n=1 Tax=Vitis riparia TaxID=96939 RepID=UPI00155A5850|nr:ankyrin repeat-containing protein At5g02620-like [Vitis riparia]